MSIQYFFHLFNFSNVFIGIIFNILIELIIYKTNMYKSKANF